MPTNLFVTVLLLLLPVVALQADDFELDELHPDQITLYERHGITAVPYPQSLRTDDPVFDDWILSDVIDMMSDMVGSEEWMMNGGDSAFILDYDLDQFQIVAPLHITSECLSFMKRLDLALNGDDSTDLAQRMQWQLHPPPHHWIFDGEFADLRHDHERGLHFYDLTALHQQMNRSHFLFF